MPWRRFGRRSEKQKEGRSSAGKMSKFKVLRGKKLIEVSARVVEWIRLPPKEHGYEPVVRMIGVIEDMASAWICASWCSAI